MSDPVLDLLNKNSINFTISGRDFVIKCLNPDHEDTNPSCRVDRVTGVTHCFSCGFKADIFKHFGITSNIAGIKVAKLKQKLRDLNNDINGIEFPTEKIPLTQSFRGISIKTLREFSAFYTNIGDDKYVDRVWFPIKDLSGKVRVYVGRHMLSDGNPRYRNYPEGVTLPIYPEVFTERYTSVVLVEGIFDMLNLYDKGLHNVACTFGTSTLMKNTSSKLLTLKTQGITKIYLMYDGDAPGQEAMEKLKPLIEEAGYLVEKIVLEDGTDPGDMDKEYVDSIKEWINEENSNSRESSQ